MPTPHKHRAFTLIEVLVVVAIIALLIAILIPSLTRARDQAKIVACLSNMSNLPKAVQMFAQSHKGFGQAVCTPKRALKVDPTQSKYAYHVGSPVLNLDLAEPTIQPWPIALARDLGYPTVKDLNKFFSNTYNPDPGWYFGQFTKMDVLLCPADKAPVNNVRFPIDNMYGCFSYAVNEDVFGVTNPGGIPAGGPTNEIGGADEGKCWKDGAPDVAPRLEGKLEKILRPSEVALFCDGGTDVRSGTSLVPPLLITNVGNRGPYLENLDAALIRDPSNPQSRLPFTRHSKQGGLSVACADGSGRYAKPVRMTTINGVTAVEQYSPRIRISPYNIGTLTAGQP